MIKLLSFKEKNIILNPHFWIIICIMFALAILYDSWPWKDWDYWLWRLATIEFSMDLIGSIFLIPIVYAAIVFRWRGVLVVWSLSMMIILPQIIEHPANIESLLRNIAFLLFPVLIVLIITLELKWREKERRAMQEREAERRVYMSQIFKVQEDERMRIAQELHDDTTQTLLVIANRAQALVSSDHNKTESKIIRDAEWIRDATLRVSDDVRRLSLYLRPSILDNMGLIPALRWLADKLQKEDNIDTKILVDGVERKLPNEVEINIFRIIQEALNNVRRHSGAGEAIVCLKFRPDSLKISIKDNGVGFSLREIRSELANRGKLGLIGMDQRTQFLNGTFNVHSKPGKGTSISIQVNC